MYFTFHSGYILITRERKEQETKIKLYIPFWIYSNKGQRQVAVHHKWLYIPFWIYSNLHRYFSFVQGSRLYIPFWIYSNNFSRLTKVSLFLFFTFHSGYILMYTGKGFRVTDQVAFTFHSGYILMTADAVKEQINKVALHSILDIF